MSEQLMVDPLLLRANPWNPNHVSPDNEEKLAESIRQLGLFKPIVVREIPLHQLTGTIGEPRYEILGGENRWEYEKANGIKLVPIFNVGMVSDEIAQKISLADNARYGADDMIEMAKLLEGLGDASEIQAILPYSEADISAIFSSVNIALDSLDLPESYEEEPAPPSERAEKAPKTHTIMRFKVPLGDAEKITELIVKIQKRQNFTASDDLTNAGDALVHQLFGAA